MIKPKNRSVFSETLLFKLNQLVARGYVLLKQKSVECNCIFYVCTKTWNTYSLSLFERRQRFEGFRFQCGFLFARKIRVFSFELESLFFSSLLDAPHSSSSSSAQKFHWKQFAKAKSYQKPLRSYWVVSECYLSWNSNPQPCV